MAAGLLLTALLLGAAQAGADVAATGGANPIRKVVTLLQDMQKEIEAEGEKEKELFDKFMCFCQGNTAEMEKGISDGKAKLADAQGKLESDAAEKSQLELAIVQHKKDREGAQQDLEKATTIRSKELSEYEQDAADFKANIAATGSAITSLEKGMGGAALLQVPDVGNRLMRIANDYSVGSDYQREKISAFLQQRGDFVPQSGQIVGILKNMKDEMEASTKKADEDEAASVAGFGELKASKEQEIAVATEAVKTKSARVGELAVTVVQTQDDIEDTTTEIADTEKFLAGLQEACPAKEKEWAERTKLRGEEVSAISEAINILNDDDALDTFKKAVPSAFIQDVPDATRYGFLQRAGTSMTARAQKARALLDSVGQSRKHSVRMKLALYMARGKLLSARHMQAPSFGNISGMIEDMVVLEEEEQGADDKQKPWCNGEFEKEDREEKSENSDIASLDAAMEEETDMIASLDEEIAALKEEIEALDKSVAQATEQRKEEHADYQETASLTQTAIELVGKAKNRLQKFYNPTLYKAPPKKEMTMEEKIIAGGAAFMQVRRVTRVAPPVMPETFGSYEKKGAKSGGVMALLDNIAKELEGSLSDAEYAEKTAQKDYVSLMADSQETRQSDVKSVTDKESAKAEITNKKTLAQEGKMADIKDLNNIHTYVTELHGSCDFILENYDVRKTARHGEIESLKNAKAILSGAKI